MNKYHRRSTLFLICVGSMLFCSLAMAAVERPMGLIVSVMGDVTIAHGGKSKLAVEGLVLEPGDTVVVKIGGLCSGFGLDGQPFRLKGPSELVLSVPSSESTANKIRAFIARQLAQWSGASRSRSLVSRATRDWERTVQVPTPVMPGNNGAVRVGSARFVWATAQGLDRYIITIAPADGEGVKQTIRGHTLFRDDLEPGAEYVWKVHGDSDAFKIGSQWSAFRVLTPEEEKELDEALTDLSDIEAGVLLLSMGLHEEAIYRFDSAVASDASRRSALRWRAEALASVGLYRDAYDDLVGTIER